ncbi:hypothetical protein AL035_11285 [Salipiger aestuarii]|uniref:CPN protein n=1 Tax=Salipiger aestuarii TaxID=568098 RepID=A0A327Y106_9RHOB|nr:hypothetical protein [Salipiger aestuarii]KAB2541638.1 hypothetical protein AL035_11285 [Salipiger aestuarii]RAK14898.1 hypothetical protein ATI53_102729 [Salipiger aestuarii]
MVSSSKILTVSYGTFSCTAEGFEDPLDVVKETTHFFRGVVRDDRFFGAEPPQFDPEMAAEILQAQLAPSHGEGQLTLGNPYGTATGSSGASSGAMSAALAAGPTIQRGPPDAAGAQRAPQTATPGDPSRRVSEPETSDSDDAPVHQDVTTEVLAALARQDRWGHDEPGHDEPGRLAEPDIATAADDQREAQTTDRLRHGTEERAPDSIASLVASGNIADDRPDDLILLETGAAPMAPAQGLADPDTVSDKLQRIRAVVARGDTPAAPADAADAPADNLFAGSGPEIDLETGDYTSPYADDIEDETVLDAPFEADRDAAPARVIGDDLTGDMPPDDESDMGLFDEDQGVADEELGGADHAQDDRDAAEAAPHADAFWADELAEDDGDEDLFSDVDLAEGAVPGTPLGHAAEWPSETGTRRAAPVPPAAGPDGPLRPRARVIKVKRTAFDAAVARGLIAPDDADGADTVSSLSSEDEDDLARELEAVRAELQAGFAQAWDDDDTPTERAEENVAPPRHAETGDDWLLGEGWEDDLDEDMTEAAPADAPRQAGAMLREQAPVPPDGTPAAQAPMPVTEQVGAPMTPSLTEAVSQIVAGAEDDDFGTARHGAPDTAQDDLDNMAVATGDDGDTDENRSLSVTAHLARMAQEDVRKAIKMSSPGRVMLTETSVEDNDASRILDETNSQLREPEGNRRRSAIAHLRAAVAATRADRRLGRKKDAEKASEPYREDLADVVRPRRPEAPAVHTDRPVDQTRAAPLKLVAEQRVDSARVSTRPRRVRVADIDEDTGDSDSGFAEYADSVGARDLPELLEAAAAYMSFVERREQFSRPQLMTKVRQAEQSESSREDRLRTFGQLLREGKIEKTRGGRFTASERISFKPDARAAG